MLGYAVVHPRGVLLFDTGMAECDAETAAWYRPARRPLAEALKEAEVSVDDIRWVVNCHLHFDHCGGNRALAGRPVFVQSTELSVARTTRDYTLGEAIDFPDARYEEVQGEAEILPGVLVIPTPGHTDGHQALAVISSDGTIVLAGQAFNTAFEYGSDDLARRARREESNAHQALAYAPWIDRLAKLDPRRILFAHDAAVWEPLSSLSRT